LRAAEPFAVPFTRYEYLAGSHLAAALKHPNRRAR
jgi:hypothetical protein